MAHFKDQRIYGDAFMASIRDSFKQLVFPSITSSNIMLSSWTNDFIYISFELIPYLLSGRLPSVPIANGSRF